MKFLRISDKDQNERGNTKCKEIQKYPGRYRVLLFESSFCNSVYLSVLHVIEGTVQVSTT